MWSCGTGSPWRRCVSIPRTTASRTIGILSTSVFAADAMAADTTKAAAPAKKHKKHKKAMADSTAMAAPAAAAPADTAAPAPKKHKKHKKAAMADSSAPAAK